MVTNLLRDADLLPFDIIDEIYLDRIFEDVGSNIPDSIAMELVPFLRESLHRKGIMK